MSLRVHRRDTELRLLTKFGENRPLRSSRKVASFTKQKNSGSAGLVPALFYEGYHKIGFFLRKNFTKGTTEIVCACNFVTMFVNLFICQQNYMKMVSADVTKLSG